MSVPVIKFNVSETGVLSNSLDWYAKTYENVLSEEYVGGLSVLAKEARKQHDNADGIYIIRDVEGEQLLGDLSLIVEQFAGAIATGQDIKLELSKGLDEQIAGEIVHDLVRFGVGEK